MKVKTYCINKGQTGQYFGLMSAEEGFVLPYAPNNWRPRRARSAGRCARGWRLSSDHKAETPSGVRRGSPPGADDGRRKGEQKRIESSRVVCCIYIKDG